MDINVRFGNAPKRRRRKKTGIAAVILAVIAAVAVLAGRMAKAQPRASADAPRPGVAAPK